MTKLERVFRTMAVCLISALAGGPLAAQPVAGLEAPVHVYRDSTGIPHIFADNEHDLYFLQGWVHAEDRMFQMDLFRRQASGTLAELLGPPALGSDVELRTLGLRRAAERSAAALSPDVAAALVAYAGGVNAYIRSHPPPLEYALLELTAVEPWSALDSLVIAKLFAFSLSFDLDIGLTETLLAYQLTGDVAGFDGVALFFEDLFRSAPFDPASTVPDAISTEQKGIAGGVTSSVSAASAATETAATAELHRRFGAAARRLPRPAATLARSYLERIRDVPLLADAASPRERQKGSNEWAVSGTRTDSGRPLLANDPHLALDLPATFHQIHLRSRGNDGRGRQDVIGSGFVGTPFVVLGHNRSIAWGATTNPLDVTDTYVEQIVPSAASPSGLATVYLGQPEPVIPIPEVFRYNIPGDASLDNLVMAPPGGVVAGVFVPPVTLIVPRRNQGPIVALDAAQGFALSVQFTGFSATRELETLYRWNKARDLGEFVNALQLFDFGSQNWAYADAAGNIAYFTSGEMPLREDLEAATVNGLPPYFLRDGTGGNEWKTLTEPQPGQAVPYEVLPFTEMPQLINPPHGYFVNANNDPAGTTLDNNPLNQLRPTGGIYYLNPGYASGFRAGRITQALREKLDQGPVTAADMADIQADTQMLDAQFFVPHILAAFDAAGAAGAHPALAAFAADPRMAEAVARLAAWDFTTPTGIAEGYDHSDVDGMRLPPGDAEIAASVAATLYSVWRGRMIAHTIDPPLAAFGLPRPGSSQAMTALRTLFERFPVLGGMGVSGVDFFPRPVGADAATRRDWTVLASLAATLERLAGSLYKRAFGSSTDQDDYRWGRLHRIVFQHPFGRPFNVPGFGFPQPLAGLNGVPTDGGFGTVDASSHSARADHAYAFLFGSGPVRRFVGEIGPGPIVGHSSLPGGESASFASPFYNNLLPLWLTNDSYELLNTRDDILGDLATAELFVPAP